MQVRFWFDISKGSDMLMGVFGSGACRGTMVVNESELRMGRAALPIFLKKGRPSRFRRVALMKEPYA